MLPTSDDQIRFLVNLQRLLDEGSFVASYKFALLLSLADLCIERGDDSGASMPVDTAAIAEKFIRYYWRQAVPYPSPAEARVLQQNAGQQAAIVNAVRDARAAYGDSLPNLMKKGTAWRSLVTRVERVVRAMPLQYLQNVGGKRLDFLYAEVRRVIELRPGVAFCLRKFHPLIGDLVRGAWVRYVRRQNLDLLGESADLHEFLFGSERAALAVVRPVLLDTQRGRCFYCRAALTPAATHVDHFIAWARYPVDLGHNFVLADSRCNGQKRDRLPACDHLAAWVERNATFGAEMATELEQRGVIADLASSNRVTRWAYSQTEGAGGVTWVRADEMVPLAATWRDLI
jgi:hypothetical protein